MSEIAEKPCIQIATRLVDDSKDEDRDTKVIGCRLGNGNKAASRKIIPLDCRSEDGDDLTHRIESLYSSPSISLEKRSIYLKVKTNLL